ncbi:glycosyltransferase family 2 protein [Clostridiisalibacter paucivorans]|uniref:glycosyltransferase family 2 protein n=1 Tax=Clostridiisalibacter paucivorans TaxID=408753 RepID=UPI00047A1EC3|nr:glycosyltransferase family 2 protein [Clostridiisalibacter paucivorans]
MGLAIVLPVYNEEQCIYDNFYKLKEILAKDKIKCKYVFVDDGSVDKSWKIINEIASQEETVYGIKFSRNFGKELAIVAGLEIIQSDRYLIMDADLQHPPTEIKNMLKMMDETGVNIIDGIKVSRGRESILYRFLANSFYRLLRQLTGLNLKNSSDFKLIDKSVAQNIKKFKEKSIFFRGVVDWVGFTRKEYYFRVNDRIDGKSSFSISKLIKFALSSILSHTSKPLYLTIFFGVIFFGFSIILGVQTLFNYFSGISIDGFTTVILLILITGSVIMFTLGIVGIYIARIYDEVKQRPQYIISERIERL